MKKITATCQPDPRFSYLRLGRNLNPRDAGWRRGGPMEYKRFGIAMIRQWAGRGGNLAVRTGKQSSAFVLDVDRHGDVNGFESLAELIERHGQLPETYTVKTGGGGRHFYFFCPADFEVHSSAGLLAPGLDIKGERSYVVAPGSIKPDGRPYEVLVDGPIAHAPEWLLDWLRERSQKAAERAVRVYEVPPKVETPEVCCEAVAEAAVAALVRLMDRLRAKEPRGRIMLKGKPRGWDEGYYLLGTRLAQVAMWPYTRLTLPDAERIFFAHVPEREQGFDPEHKWDDAVLRAECDPWGVGEDHRLMGHGPSVLTLATLVRKGVK